MLEWNRTIIDGGNAVSDSGVRSRFQAPYSSNAADGSCSPPPPPPHILYSIPTFNPGSAFALEAAAAVAAAEQAQHLLEGTVGGAVGNSGIGKNEERRPAKRACADWEK